MINFIPPQKKDMAIIKLVTTLKRLRESTQHWERVYGSEAKNKKKRAEVAADKLIEELTTDAPIGVFELEEEL